MNGGATKHGFQSAASIGAGCLIAALLAVAAIAAFSLLAVRGSQLDIARRAFPAGVELGDVLHQESGSGGREGCVLVIFRLGDDAVQSLQENSAVYLEGLGDQTRSGRMLSGWRETPMWRPQPERPIAGLDRVYDMINADAAWGCNNRLAARARGPQTASLQLGSHYATYSNGEGAIVLIPSERVAVFLYYG